MREIKIYLPGTHAEESQKKEKEEEMAQKKTVAKNEGEVMTKK